MDREGHLLDGAILQSVLSCTGVDRETRPTECQKLRLAVRGSSFCDVKVSLQTRATYTRKSKIGPLSRRLPIPVKVPKAILQGIGGGRQAFRHARGLRPGETFVEIHL